MGSHGLPKHGNNARVVRLRYVEAQEGRGRLRNAEHIAWGKHDVVCHGQTSEGRGILAVGQAAPKIKAAARQ